MYGRHTDRSGMLIGTPSQTNNYLDTKCTPKHIAFCLPRQRRPQRRRRALDELRSPNAMPTIKIFSMLD